MFSVVLNRTQNIQKMGLIFFMFHISFQLFWNSYSICLPTDIFFLFSIFISPTDIFDQDDGLILALDAG